MFKDKKNAQMFCKTSCKKIFFFEPKPINVTSTKVLMKNLSKQVTFIMFNLGNTG